MVRLFWSQFTISLIGEVVTYPTAASIPVAAESIILVQQAIGHNVATYAIVINLPSYIDNMCCVPFRHANIIFLNGYFSVILS